MQRHVEISVRAQRGKLAEMTSDDKFQIRGAINEALIDFTIDRGIDAPKTAIADTEANTVANQSFVDLDSAVTQVMDGTVRIVAEDQILAYFSGGLGDFYAVDPGEDFSGPWPTAYSIDTNQSGAIRLRLRPTPSRADTISFKAEVMVDEDDIGDFPGWYHGAMRVLATAISFEALGMDGSLMQGRYEERYKNIREQQRGRSGPQHIQLRQRLPRAASPQNRADI